MVSHAYKDRCRGFFRHWCSNYIPSTLGRLSFWLVVSLSLSLSLPLLVTCGKDSPTQPQTPEPTPPPPPPTPVATRVEITPTSANLTSIGQTVQLTATVFDQNNAVMTSAVVTWTSSAAGVATVSSQGLVTSVAYGTATINGRSGSASASITVTIKQSAGSVVIEPSSATLMSPGETVQLTASVLDGAGQPVADATVTWSSSDASVATVSGAGLVTAVSNGSVTITARSGSASASVPVTVMQSAGSIAIEPSSATLMSLGETVQLAASVLDGAGQPVADAAVTWSSSDASVATVSGAGLVTAVSNGSVTITARSGSASGAAEITVIDDRVERETLTALYNATSGAHWTVSTNWLSDEPLGTWHGVTTNSDGRVTGLDLSDNRLRGQIPAEIGQLRNLVTLVFYTNHLTGQIPPEIGQLQNLEALHLGSNYLTGQIPLEVGRLDYLKILQFAANRDLTGPLPSTLLNLKLDLFYIHNTSLCVPPLPTFRQWIDTIPESLVDNSDYCPGPAVVIEPSSMPPMVLGESMQLTASVLDQNGQSVAGAMVAWSSSDPAVAEVSSEGLVTAVTSGTAQITASSDSLWANVLIVVVQSPEQVDPSASVCYRTPKVRDAIMAALGMDDCSVVSAMELQTITELEMEGRDLTVLRSGDFSGLSYLTDLDLHNNALTELPEDVFADLSRLKVLDLSENALVALPADIFAGLSNLTILTLIRNALTSLPEDVFAGPNSLQHIRLEHNMLTSLPVGIFRGLRNLQVLELDFNPLTSLPEGIFVGLESFVAFSARGTEIDLPLIIENTSDVNDELHIQVVFPHGAFSDVKFQDFFEIELKAKNAEPSEIDISIRSGETHSSIHILKPTRRNWSVTATRKNTDTDRGWEMESAILASEVRVPRSFSDRPDDISGPQIHVVYAVSTYGKDRELDRLGYIADSFDILQDWWRSEAGLELRLDTYQGELDVTFLEIDRTIEEQRMIGFSRTLRLVESQLPQSGEKKYAVFYDINGPSSGVASDRTALTFLWGRVPGRILGEIGDAEETMMHEFVHLFGGVPECAPHSTTRLPGDHWCGRTGHIYDDPDDIMYVDPVTGFYGVGRVLDADRDDYLGHGRTDCTDIARSPYLE